MSVSPNWTKVARNRVETEFHDRRIAIAREIGRIKGEYGARGALNSGMTIQAIERAVEHEYTLRAQLVWQIWAHALAAERAAVTPGLKAEVIEELGRSVDDHGPCADLRQAYADAQGLMRRAGEIEYGRLEEMRERALKRTESEIDFALMEAGRTGSDARSTQTFNFYSPVGVVAGPGSTNQVTMTFTPGDREAVLQALDAVDKAIGQSGQLSPELVGQIQEVVSETRIEARKEKPNALKLRTALAGIGQTVQVLGSGAAAYNLVKAAAQAFGLSLP